MYSNVPKAILNIAFEWVIVWVFWGTLFKQSVPGLGNMHNEPLHTHICREYGSRRRQNI